MKPLLFSHLGPIHSNRGAWYVLMLRLPPSLSCNLVTGPRPTRLGTMTQVPCLHSWIQHHGEQWSVALWARGWLQQLRSGPADGGIPGGLHWDTVHLFGCCPPSQKGSGDLHQGQHAQVSTGHPSCFCRFVTLLGCPV